MTDERTMMEYNAMFYTNSFYPKKKKKKKKKKYEHP